MSRLTRPERMVLAGATVLAMGIWLGGTAVTPAEESGDQASDETDEITPYTGPPIFLEEPEPKPPAQMVSKQVDTQKYDDGTTRLEREFGIFSDDHIEADGFYREYYPSGQLFAEGQFRRGQQHGEWTYWHENGKQNRKVVYNNGLLEGEWEVRRADETLAAKRSYKDGKRHGVWVIYDDTGEQPLREESYADGKANGVWKVWYPSGQQRTQISFKAGERDGPAVEWDEKGNKRAELTYVANKPHGTATAWAADGRKVVQRYDHGKLIRESKD